MQNVNKVFPPVVLLSAYSVLLHQDLNKYGKAVKWPATFYAYQR